MLIKRKRGRRDPDVSKLERVFPGVYVLSLALPGEPIPPGPFGFFRGRARGVDYGPHAVIALGQHLAWALEDDAAGTLNEELSSKYLIETLSRATIEPRHYRADIHSWFLFLRTPEGPWTRVGAGGGAGRWILALLRGLYGAVPRRQYRRGNRLYPSELGLLGALQAGGETTTGLWQPDVWCALRAGEPPAGYDAEPLGHAPGDMDRRLAESEAAVMAWYQEHIGSTPVLGC